MTEISLLLFNSMCENILTAAQQDHFKLTLYGKNAIYENWRQLNSTGYFLERVGDDVILWLTASYQKDLEVRKRKREEAEVYNSILEERREKLFETAKSLCKVLGFEESEYRSEVIMRMAEKALERKSKSSEDLLGVTFEGLRELPKKHEVIEKDGGYKV